ncbi:MAG: GntR family transcriptional regulator [Hyphomicrobiaceae bacterium]|nr:GntR family transcriptional regulator [Hyphomicrobiaceae bacterium]
MSSKAMFQTRSLYLLVYDELANRVATGLWKPGAMLPSEQELAAELSVSTGTVRKALAELESRHLIERRQGRGTFVVDQETERICDRFCNFYNADGRRFAGAIIVKELTTEPAAAEEQKLFRLPSESQCVRIHQVRQMHGQVFMSEEVAVPAALFSAIKTQGDIPPNLGSLAQRNGIILENAVETVELRPLTARAAADLERQPGEPALFVRRVVYATGHRPVHLRCGYCILTNNISYRVNLV